ncbi:MAG: hypothetical protein EPN22_14200 [Nitrospirae bacterium]|nr:MAG: hypothetical protein EPN22_14200 [Nitrospirota bacterium]
MIETLYGKTFMILGFQLGVTWLSTVCLIGLFRRLYLRYQVEWVDGQPDADGNLNLDLNWEVVKPYFWTLLITNFMLFLALMFYGTTNLYIGIPLFTFWSVLTGFELALCLISVDENLGGRVLALTALITVAAGLIGAKSGIDFYFLDGILFFSLLLLIIFGFIRIFYSIPRWGQRVAAFFGVVVFTGYLLYDFNRLSAMNKNAAANTWGNAMEISISIYLDIINLFLDLLDLLSN